MSTQQSVQAQVTQAVESALPGGTVTVTMEGNHAHITAVSSAFEGLTPVKKQQLVYAALQDLVGSGVIHAIHLTTLTPDEAGR